MEKERYDAPVMEIAVFDTEDVITTSNIPGDEEVEG